MVGFFVNKPDKQKTNEANEGACSFVAFVAFCGKPEAKADPQLFFRVDSRRFASIRGFKKSASLPSLPSVDCFPRLWRLSRFISSLPSVDLPEPIMPQRFEQKQTMPVRLLAKTK